jgi:hypothetical protein
MCTRPRSAVGLEAQEIALDLAIITRTVRILIPVPLFVVMRRRAYSSPEH